MTERSCGSCFSCCVWLGIAELRKHTGQTCKHLTGTQGPEQRCSIYAQRPKACAEYQCLWRSHPDFGNDDDRPDRSGLLVTAYQAKGTGPFAATIIVTDPSKAGSLAEGSSALARFVETLLRAGCDEIIANNFHNKTALLFRDGQVYQGKLTRGTGFEEHIFIGDDKPIAAYQTFADEAAAALWTHQHPVRDGQTRIIR